MDDDSQLLDESLDISFVSADNPKKNDKWTDAQDERLRTAVRKYDEREWKKVAEFVGDGKTHVQCLHRWKKVLSDTLIKGKWTKEEDENLIALMADGDSFRGWTDISLRMKGDNPKGRIGKQCRERWTNHLHPLLIRTEFTDEDNITLLQCKLNQPITTNVQWTIIAAAFQHKDGEGRIWRRSENSIKNHWNNTVSNTIVDYLKDVRPDVVRSFESIDECDIPFLVHRLALKRDKKISRLACTTMKKQMKLRQQTTTARRSKPATTSRKPRRSDKNQKLQAKNAGDILKYLRSYSKNVHNGEGEGVSSSYSKMGSICSDFDNADDEENDDLFKTENGPAVLDRSSSFDIKQAACIAYQEACRSCTPVSVCSSRNVKGTPSTFDRLVLVNTGDFEESFLNSPFDLYLATCKSIGGLGYSSQTHLFPEAGTPEHIYSPSQKSEREDDTTVDLYPEWRPGNRTPIIPASSVEKKSKRRKTEHGCSVDKENVPGFHDFGFKNARNEEWKGVSGNAKGRLIVEDFFVLSSPQRSSSADWLGTLPTKPGPSPAKHSIFSPSPGTISQFSTPSQGLDPLSSGYPS